MNQEYAIEPIEFAFKSNLFKGLLGTLNKKVIVIYNVDDAYKYALEQNLPSNYKVWTDVIENYRKSLRKNVRFQEAYDFVNSHLERLQLKNASSIIEFRKKKINKVNTAYDDFIFSEAKEDAFFVLCTVAINRYLGDFVDDLFLEDVFALYKLGGWPCGMKNSTLLVFDPNSVR